MNSTCGNAPTLSTSKSESAEAKSDVGRFQGISNALLSYLCHLVADRISIRIERDSQKTILVCPFLACLLELIKHPERSIRQRMPFAVRNTL